MHLLDPCLLKTDFFIAGRWCDSADIIDVINPITQQTIAQVSAAASVDVQAAITAAEQAQGAWQQTPAFERAALLKKWHQLILQHQSDLALILQSEQGKPEAEAWAEVSYAASFVEWFAEEARRIDGVMHATLNAERQLMTTRQAVGVVAAITPWNFPAAMVTRKLAPALAAGCTVILKPSEHTPLTALALTVLAERAGFPAGVLNVVPTLDTQNVGTLLCASPRVRKLTFTGSTAVGKWLYQQCADTVKRLSLELGGNAPALVFADADLSVALRAVMAAKFRNSGQTCVCINRIYVEQPIYAKFAELLHEAIQQLRTDPTASDRQLGPLVHQAAVARVDLLVQQALQMGAQLRCGGRALAENSWFYQPTLLLDANSEMPIMQQEIFGPVAVLQAFSSESEAIALANQSRAGLAAYAFTRDGARIWRLCAALEAGMVGINETAISNEIVPFGGIKESGLGREGSRVGLDDYLEYKHICWGITG